MTLGTATKKRTYVRAGGEEIAWQNGDSGGSVVFQAADAAGMSLRSAEPNGDIFDAQGSESSPAELDPLGNNVGQETPFVVTTGGSSCVGCGLLDETMPLWAANGEPRYVLDGLPIGHEEAHSLMQAGSAYACPNNYCGPGIAVNSVTGRSIVTSPFQVFADGSSGYRMPIIGETSVRMEGVNDETDYAIIGWRFVKASDDPSTEAGCNAFIASLFGGPGAVVTTTTDFCFKVASPDGETTGDFQYLRMRKRL